MSSTPEFVSLSRRRRQQPQEQQKPQLYIRIVARMMMTRTRINKKKPAEHAP